MKLGFYVVQTIQTYLLNCTLKVSIMKRVNHLQSTQTTVSTLVYQFAWGKNQSWIFQRSQRWTLEALWKQNLWGSMIWSWKWCGPTCSSKHKGTHQQSFSRTTEVHYLRKVMVRLYQNDKHNTKPFSSSTLRIKSNKDLSKWHTVAQLTWLEISLPSHCKEQHFRNYDQIMNCPEDLEDADKPKHWPMIIHRGIHNNLTTGQWDGT